MFLINNLIEKQNVIVNEYRINQWYKIIIQGKFKENKQMRVNYKVDMFSFYI